MTKEKYIAISLFTELWCEMLDHKIDYVNKQYDLIVGVHQWNKDGNLWCLLTKGGSKPSVKRVKPLLRPLSDLTKEIEHDGETFIPIDILADVLIECDSVYKKESAIEWINFIVRESILQLPYILVDKLVEWHFDIVNLIEKGEAIDINASSFNPYK